MILWNNPVMKRVGFKLAMELRSTRRLLCEAHLFIAIIASFFDIFRVFIIQMIVKYLKQYNYIYNLCRLNEIHLEFAKLIFYKHRQKSASLFTLIIVKHICYTLSL